MDVPDENTYFEYPVPTLLNLKYFPYGLNDTKSTEQFCN